MTPNIKSSKNHQTPGTNGLELTKFVHKPYELVKPYILRDNIGSKITATKHTAATKNTAKPTYAQKARWVPATRKQSSRKNRLVLLKQKKKAPRRTKLLREQIDCAVKDGPPVEPNKYKLLYFDGFKRNRVTWVKQVLANSSINTRAVANIAWIGESTIQLCVNSKNVLKLSNAICKITDVTKNTTFCTADTLEQ
ncbi:hypothetical protein BB561_006527 [Smittium simulii]|uniref:Uncharacterized protein n=1 Tax=Smittium simulii TaxID=133385 RepID=A0A2T9Y3C3_9FUNG|nr:hypothetical protein BB561_006527 [Smittium simulii]